jgi:ribose transport system substrate-binding protein
MNRRISRLIVLLVVFGLFMTLGGVMKAEAQLKGAPNEEYIAVACMGNLEYFSAHKFAWKWMGDKLGVKTSYIGPAEYDVPGQIAAFDQAIARRPAGIAVFGVEESLGPQIDKAVAAGIPVVTFSGDVPNSRRATFVGTNQHDLGYFGGIKLAEVLDGKGDVAILSIPGVGMFDVREQGFKDAFAKYPGIRVVQTGDTKADTVTAINAAKAIMQRFPNLTAFACTDSTGGIAAATAVSEAGKAGRIKIVSMDRNSDVLQKISAGVVTGTIAQDDCAEMVWCLMVLFSKKHFDPPLSSDNVKAKVEAAPFNIFTSVSWVDKSNVQYFLEANKMYNP